MAETHRPSQERRWQTKAIKFFIEVDQFKLAAERWHQDTSPLTLLVFRQTRLSARCLSRRIRLPGSTGRVRLLVFEDERGEVWAAYTELRLHRETGTGSKAWTPNRFQKGRSGVIASITSSREGPNNHDARYPIEGPAIVWHWAADGRAGVSGTREKA